MIIGGGPAGMMAAIRAGMLQQDVTLIEKNEILGKKLLISGHGRCNVTNVEEREEFLNHYFKKGDFLRDAFKRFSNTELIDFLKAQGVQLKTEDNGRVLPASDKAGSIVEALLKELQKYNVNIMAGTAVGRLRVRDNRVCSVELEDERQLETGAVVVATGGITYPLTGSNGGFFKTLKNIGHTIVPLQPALVPLEIEAWYGATMLGVSIEDCIVSTANGSRSKHSARGAIIFTHWGLSGPAILSLSRFVVANVQEKGAASLSLDILPDMSEEEIREWLSTQKGSRSQSLIKNVLSERIKRSVGEFFLGMLKIQPDRKCCEISKKDINRLAQAFKHSEFPVKRPRSNNEAMVTQGGVSLKEIDPKTMGSRLIKGLFFAGEMIDIDGDSGGYNIQLAFSTGYLAGESVARMVAEQQ
jgi:predicted Rossmann fold flavoprotein